MFCCLNLNCCVAACEKGMFHCANAGFKGIDITSSTVNDGVCDCCDGTDEYASPVSATCPNTCAALAAAEAILLAGKRKEYNTAAKLRRQCIKEARVWIADTHNEVKGLEDSVTQQRKAVVRSTFT